MSCRIAVRLALLVAAVPAAAFVACSPQSRDRPKDIVKIVARGSLTNGALMLGEAEGDFAREGIALDFTDSPTASVQALPLLERGAVDVLAGAPSAGFYAAVAMGSRSRIVADRGHVRPGACDFNAIVGSKTAFRSDSPSAAEVRGKRFSINSPGSAAFMIDAYLSRLGLSTADVDAVKLSQVLEVQAIATGAVDAMHASEPYITGLRNEGHRVLGAGTVLAPGMHIGTVIFGPNLTVANRELGKRFMRAYLRGARRWAEGPTARNIAIITSRTDFDPAVLAKACFPSIDVNGSLNLKWLLELQEWSVRKGHLDKVQGINAGVDTTFAHDAVETLGVARAAR
jgi:NitT/TauT family transport system substrate-binding protein